MIVFFSAFFFYHLPSYIFRLSIEPFSLMPDSLLPSFYLFCKNFAFHFPLIISDYLLLDCLLVRHLPPYIFRLAIRPSSLMPDSFLPSFPLFYNNFVSHLPFILRFIIFLFIYLYLMLSSLLTSFSHVI